MNMSGYNYCGECAWLDDNNKSHWDDAYYCNKPFKGGYHKLTEYACPYFIKDPKKSRNTGSYTPAGCFMTTLVCNILGYDDNCKLLNILRNFRENYLKTKKEYISLLLEYDMIGPIICNNLQMLKDNKKYALNIRRDFLIPCVQSIKENDFDNAVLIYQNLVTKLKEEFNIGNIKLPTKYDIENIGKGRIKEPIPITN